MKLSIRNIIIIILLLAFAFGGYKLSENLNQSKVENLKKQVQKERIKNDSLREVKEGLYTKLVADTLTKKQLKEKVDSLELEIEKPMLAGNIGIKPKTKVKEVEKVIIKDTTITIEDFYPQKDNYFIRYYATINTKEGVGQSEFSFQKQTLALGIGLNEDGTYKVNTKLPNYLEITDIDIEAEPINIEPTKEDNFGFLIGGGYSENLEYKQQHLKFQTGLRYKKVYLMFGANTNRTIEGTLTFEL